MQLKKFALLGTMLLASCAASPTYQSSPQQIGATSISFGQAQAICAPRAEMAAQQASNSVLARPLDPNNAFSGTANSFSARGAAYDARQASLQSCLAEYGWALNSQCVANCN